VGRDHHLTLLQEIFDRMMLSKQSELVVIHGAPGTGKTSLIQSFLRNIPSEVLQTQGKFDQLQSDTPYLALVSASDQLCRQIMSRHNSTEIRDRIRSSLGPDIDVLVNLIPSLVEVKTSVDVSLSASNLKSNVGNSFTRFKLLFRTLVRSIASSENPVIFVLDDLQWADIASLEVLKLLITDMLLHNMMIVCAFREGEISVETLRKYHLVTRDKDDENSASSTSTELNYSASVTNMAIDCLDITQVNHLVSMKLGMDILSTQSLSHLVMKKTGGNPFFVLNFLEMLSKNSLLKNLHGTGWTWDQSEILRLTNVTDNLASILESKLQCLPEQIISILQIASFIGHVFSASILTKIVYEEQGTIASEFCFRNQTEEVIKEQIMSTLKIALEKGILEKSHTKEEYKFAHDKIQEVLYEALMPDETERKFLHQRIGVLIWNSVKAIEKSKIDDEIIFLAANNLNRALSLVDYLDDKYSLVELNNIAAKRAILKSAFLSAAKYLRNAVSLLYADCWNEKYELCLDVFNSAAETEKNIGCYSRSAYLVAKIHKHAKTLIHRCTAFAIEIDSLTIQGNIKGAVALGLDALCQLDIKFPRKISSLVVLKELISTKLVMRKKKLQNLLSYPEIKDENILLSMSIMNLVAINAFVLADIYKDTYATVCLRMLRLTLKHGVSIHSPMAVVFWGSLNTILGRYDVSLECEELALSIVEKHDMDSVRGVTTIISYGVNHFWRKKFDSESRNEFLQAYQSALRYGNTNIAHYGFVGWLSAAFYLDDYLSDVHRLTRSYVSEMREYDSQSGLMFILPIWQGVGLTILDLIVH
jgi:predicted ATPase